MMQNVAANRKRLSSRKGFRLLSLSRLNKSSHNPWNGSLLNLLKREFLRLLKKMYMLFPFHALERGYRFPFRSLLSLSNLSRGHQ
jgi:hypothetical protein